MVICSMHRQADYMTAMVARRMRMRLQIRGDAHERSDRMAWRRRACREAIEVLRDMPRLRLP